MLPVTFPQANLTLKHDEDNTNEAMVDVNIYSGDIETPLGIKPVIISCWAFSREDLEDIRKNGVIWIAAFSKDIPSMTILTENPFDR